MTPDHAALARAYVEASSSHDLAAIGRMFSEDATYDSTGVGSHRGRAPIIETMEAFFAAYPDVTWEVDTYEVVADRTVEFDLVMTATHRDGGEKLLRRGRERIEFTVEGLIRHVAVDVS